MEREENRIKQNSKIIALTKYKKEFVNFYKINIDKLSRMIQKSYFSTANQNIIMYVEIQNKEVTKLIENKKEQLENLKSLKEKGNEPLKERLEKCDNFLNQIEVIK